MKKIFYFSINTCLILLLIFLYCSCALKTDNLVQKKYKHNADYYEGLHLLREENYPQARAKFRNCIRKGSYLFGKKSAIQLTKFGSLADKSEACELLVKKFPDSDSLLIAAKHFASIDENSKILKITKKIDFEKEDDQLISIRLQTLKKVNSSHFKEEVYKWFTCKKLSSEHYNFYKNYYSNEIQEINFLNDYQINLENNNQLQENNASINIKDFVIFYRVQLYRQNYQEALSLAEKLITYFEAELLIPNEELASDIGKTFLYGNKNFFHNGVKLSNLAQKYKSTEVEFFFWFYAGRCFEKGQSYYTRTKEAYSNSLLAANDNYQKDNVLWYIMNHNLTLSLEDTIKTLGNYAKEIHQKEYFDDFFDKLTVSLLVNGNWIYFEEIIPKIDGYASDEIVGRLSYIYGRLIQEGYIKTENDNLATYQAFTRALKSGTAVYYSLMAAYQLNYTNRQVLDILFTSPGKKEFTKNKEIEELLLGYAHFGLPDLIYKEWLSFYNADLNPRASMELAKFLNKCAAEKEEYYTQSLRIASRTFNNYRFEKNLEKEEFTLLYPKGFEKDVDYFSKKYDINSSVIYALIRSESFFEYDVSSGAGAIGLTQLMELTAADVARKLKRTSYDLLNPQDNIEFGIFYLAELLERLDYSYSQAFFSYNAGITRVRRWLKNSLQDFGKTENLPADLFLEIIPYTETREYGRKLISASIIYDLLYKDIEFSKSVEILIN